MYLLDTNVVSELGKPKPHGAVVAWVRNTDPRDLHLPVVTFGEIQTGIERARRQHPARAVELESWLDGLPASYIVLPMDAAAFREWARIMDGKPEHLSEDAMIAATARVHRLTVVTRNIKDFDPFDVPVFNPFQPS